MINKQTTPVDMTSSKTTLVDILTLNTEFIKEMDDEQLKILLNDSNDLEKGLSKEKKEELRKVKRIIQQTLNRNEKRYGELAFQEIDGIKYVSAEHIYYKMRMRHVVKPKEIEILEKWLEQKSIILNAKPKYSFSRNPNSDTKTAYFEYSTVLKKINDCYIPGLLSKNDFLEEIPFLYNKQDMLEYLGITFRRFEIEEIRALLGFYKLNISKKIVSLFSEDDVYDFHNFINYYKGYYYQDGAYKRAVSVKNCLKEYFNLPENERRFFAIEKELFVESFRKFKCKKRVKKVKEEN